MQRKTEVYFAGRCAAKMAAMECTDWIEWDHKLHIELMDHSGRFFTDHQEVMAFIDKAVTYLENDNKMIHEVLSDMSFVKASEGDKEAFREGVGHELMHIRSRQRRLLGSSQ